jgi:hypothetical protein
VKRSCELRAAAKHAVGAVRRRGLLILIVAGLALFGGYALHAGTGYAGGRGVPAATQTR